MRCGAMRDAVLLGQAEDRRHPRGELAGLDLIAQQGSKLLMQRHRGVVI